MRLGGSAAQATPTLIRRICHIEPNTLKLGMLLLSPDLSISPKAKLDEAVSREVAAT
jgi:hypothetical protein